MNTLETLCATHRLMLENYLVHRSRTWNTSVGAAEVRRLYTICYRNVPNLQDRINRFFGKSWYLDDMNVEAGDRVWCKANLLPSHSDITVGRSYVVTKLDYGSRHTKVTGIFDDNGQAIVPSARFVRI